MSKKQYTCSFNECGKTFFRDSGNVKSLNVYCSKKCYGEDRIMHFLGQQFDNWLVVSKSKIVDRRTYATCECQGDYCNKSRHEIIIQNLLNGESKQCKRCAVAIGLPSDISLSFCNSIKYDAKCRNIIYDLDHEYLINLYEQQNRLCYYSGMEFSSSPYNLSLDRLDSAKGYVEGNVVWAANIINLMKHTFTENYFLDLVNKVHLFDNKFPSLNRELKINNYHGFKGYKEVSKVFLTLFKNNNKSIDTSKLTCKMIWDQYEKQGGLCALSGNTIFFTPFYHEFLSDKVNLQNAVLNLIDRNLGCDINNLQILHKDISRIKRGMTNTDLLNLCKIIVNFRRMSDGTD